MSNRLNFQKLLFESPSVLNGEERCLERSDFDFERRLGDGAFGQVWRVRHKTTSKRFALKQVPKDKVTKMLSQFKREVFIMYELNHPHIIKLFNHFEDERYFYLIMEQAEGGNLFHKLHRERQFLERTAAQYFREVVLAVEYLHSHVPAIIHRDIKPENILLDKDGRLKLTDFGWSNYYSEDVSTPRMTLCGTLEYLPPEMIQKKAHDTAVDVWCLGILLYEMLTGTTPFKAPARERLMANIQHSKISFPSNFPPLAKDLVMRMLSRDTSDRFTIEQVKNHQWIQEQIPTRETITQELVPKILKDLEENVKISSGYQVINTEPLPNIEASPVSNAKDNYRESVKVLKDTVTACNEELIDIKLQIQQKEKDTCEFSDKLALLEGRYKEKSRELYEIHKSLNELRCKIEDANLVLGMYQTHSDQSEISERLENSRKELLERRRMLKLQTLQSENIRKSLQTVKVTNEDKENTLRELRGKLKQLKDEFNYNKNETKSKMNDLEISAFILRSRIQNQNRVELREEEKEEILILMKYTEEQVKTVQFPLIEQLEKHVEDADEGHIDKSNSVAQIKIKFEQEKGEFMHETRKKKEIITQKLKTTGKFNNQPAEEAVADVKERLEDSRKLEHMYMVSPSEIDKAKGRLTNCRAALAETIDQIEDNRRQRTELRKRIDNLRGTIDDAEFEWGTLKVQYLAQGLL